MDHGASGQRGVGVGLEGEDRQTEAKPDIGRGVLQPGRRFREVVLRVAEAAARQAGPASELFVPVALPLASAAGGLRIELPGGAVVTLPADAPAELVTTVIRAADRWRGCPGSASTEERRSC